MNGQGVNLVDAHAGLLLQLQEQLQDEHKSEQAVIARSVQAVMQVCEGTAACYLALGPKDTLSFQAIEGFRSSLLGYEIPIAPDSQTAYILSLPRSLIVSNWRTESRFSSAKLLLDHGFMSSVSGVVWSMGKPLGILGVYSPAADAFTEVEAQRLDRIAGVLGRALDWRRKFETLEHRSRHDPLTGLLNRQSSLEAVQEAVQREGSDSVLMVLDLDGFGAVNNSLGHSAGDVVLAEIAERLARKLRPSDIVGRVGGDEFVVLARLPVNQVPALADRVIGEIERLIDISVQGKSASAFVSCSIGIALVVAGESVADLFDRADQAMYLAKGRGRGRFEFARPANVTGADQLSTTGVSNGKDAVTGAARAVTNATLDAAIRSVRVAFQPIVRAGTHAVVGFEALARGPENSPLSNPLELFSAAQTLGKLAELEYAAKQAAFSQAKGLQVPLFMNVDPVVITTDGWLRSLIEYWRNLGDDAPPNIICELTERSLASAPGRLIRAVELCRAAGWAIALDDVGARSDTLAVLRLVRPEIIKLDTQMIDPNSEVQAVAVQTAIAGYRNRFAVEVVAEGIESQSDVDRARSFGSTCLQGYLFGKPSLDIATFKLPIETAKPLVVSMRVGGELLLLDSQAMLAEKRQLVAMSRQVERSASGADGVVLAVLDDRQFFTNVTRRQYEALARCQGLVGVLAPGQLPIRSTSLRMGEIEPGDVFSGYWIVLSMSPYFSLALVARKLPADEQPPDNQADLYRYRVLTDPITMSVLVGT